MRRGRCAPALVAGLFLPWAVFAQPAPAGAGSPVAPPADPSAVAGTIAPGPSSDTAPRVLSAVSDDPAQPNVAGLDDRIVLEVSSLDAILARPDVGCEDLVLFLDGIAIADSPPLSCSPQSRQVRFHLQRTDKSDGAWHALLGEPNGFRRPLAVSLGLSSDVSFATRVKHFELELVPEVPFYVFLVLLVLGLSLFVRLAASTALLRDPHVRAPAGARAPYSLARFQLAFWFFLVIAAYVFLWMITQELDTITPSVLALLGIGSGTALGASLIDSGKIAAAAQASASAEAAAAAQDLAVDSTAPVFAAPATPADPADPTPGAVRTQASRGFLNDLLMDVRGVSLYRFQMFTWTLVLGVIFVASVYDKLAMPQFSPTLLGLMGISSGTFLGAKIPES